MKFRLSMIFILLALAVCALAGCAAQTDLYEGRVKVVYMLEGGIYQNCTEPITQYYDFEEGSYNLISEPGVLSNKDITYTGYTLDGWYRTKTVNGDSVEYSGKWDFASDKVGSDGVTLYAKWSRNLSYTYNVCYLDDDGEKVTLGTYSVSEGAKFSDYLKYAAKRTGYTALGFFDSEGNAWDTSYTHPGGETDTAVDVYVEYIEGNYVLVSTAAQLTANRTGNIYLTADIDFGGANFSGFGDYKGTFIGNGHTISNFNLNYSASRNDLVEDGDLSEEGGILCISLFGRASGAVIQDVTFTGVKINISTTLSTTKMIIVAPMFIKVSGCTVTNVAYDGEIILSRLPSAFNEEDNLIVLTESAYYYKADGDKSEIDVELTEVTFTDGR